MTKHPSSGFQTELSSQLFSFSSYPCLWPLCCSSEVLAKWMLCLQHVLVLSSSLCVCVCTSPPVWFGTATLAAAFGEACVCVCGVPVLRTSWAFRDFTFVCMCVCICLSDVTVRVAAVSCCFRAKHTILTGLIN